MTTGLGGDSGARCGYSRDIEHHRRFNMLRHVANRGWSLPPPRLVPIRRSAAGPESEASAPLSASGKGLSFRRSSLQRCPDEAEA